MCAQAKTVTAEEAANIILDGIAAGGPIILEN